MPLHHSTSTPDFWGLLWALLVILGSSTLSVLNQIRRGLQASLLWVLSEYLSAILFGTLTYHAFPFVQPYLPAWVTWPLAVAFMAHSGGRIFQELETAWLHRVSSLINRKKEAP